MEKKIFIIAVLATTAVCATALAQQMNATNERMLGAVEVNRTPSHSLRPTGVLVVPWHINYQGYLTDDAGTPANDTLTMIFSIYDAPTGGTQLWNENQSVAVENGLFNVILGSLAPIPLDVFRRGASRWLELEIGAQTLFPRTEITSVAYAYRAARADTAEYASSAASDNDWSITGNVLHPSGNYGLAMRSSNALLGDSAHTHVNFGVACTTGASGQDYRWCTVSGGHGNTASGTSATVGGGGSNTASGGTSTVGGGYGNTASDDDATIGGGYDNTASGQLATVGGGHENTASATYATLGGGWRNTVSGFMATLGGGELNNASGLCAALGGGGLNNASGEYATIGGGLGNTAGGDFSMVAGGDSNSVTGEYATAVGGHWNTVSGMYATVAGGRWNSAAGDWATVPGGSLNRADGLYSLAAGSDVWVQPGADYTFAFGRNIWTSTPNAVIFHNAADPIRVGIQVMDPTNYIDVAGGAYCDGTNWVNASSREYKKDIEALTPKEYEEILQKLAGTTVVRFRFKTQEDDELHIGVIAEDAPEEIVDAQRNGIPTGDAIGFLLAALKAQQEEIELLRKDIQALRR